MANLSPSVIGKSECNTEKATNFRQRVVSLSNTEACFDGAEVRNGVGWVINLRGKEESLVLWLEFRLDVGTGFGKDTWHVVILDLAPRGDAPRQGISFLLQVRRLKRCSFLVPKSEVPSNKKVTQLDTALCI